MDNRVLVHSHALIYSYVLGCVTTGLAFSIKDICSKYNISMYNRHWRVSPELVGVFYGYGVLLVMSGYVLLYHTRQ